jgi:hypothetical protein
MIWGKLIHEHTFVVTSMDTEVVVNGDPVSSSGMSMPVCAIRECACGRKEASQLQYDKPTTWHEILEYVPERKECVTQRCGALTISTVVRAGTPVVGSLQ